MASLFLILRKQHQEMRARFKRLAHTTERQGSSRQKLLQAMVIELVSHAWAEEQVLYQNVMDRKEERPDALEMIEEHRLAEREIHAMASVDPSTERWTAMMKVLTETTEHHFEEEEDKVFPELQKLYTNKEKDEMGKEFIKRKKEQALKLKKK
jgi:hemerythrin superfamily protein